MLALWLEVRLSKRDILELYLNRVYFGGGAYGIEAAAHRYFGKSASDADGGRSRADRGPAEGAVEIFSRVQPRCRAGARTQRAEEDAGGRAGRRGGRAARVAPAIQFANSRGSNGTDRAPNTPSSSCLSGCRRWSPRGIPRSSSRRPSTRALQRRAQEIVEARLKAQGEALGAGQAAVAVLDTDGGIRALIGGRSYAESQFNRAVKARRQPGSAFKPLVYLAALESGLTPDTSPTICRSGSAAGARATTMAAIAAPCTLREALAQSINTVAARSI